MKQLVVEYLNGQTRYYPITDTKRGWTTDITGNAIHIGKGAGGTRIPLMNISAYTIEEIPDPVHVNLTETPDAIIRRYARELSAIDNILTGAGFDFPQGAQGVRDLAMMFAHASNQRTAVYHLMSLHNDAVSTATLREVYDSEGDEIDPGTRRKLAQALESWLNEKLTQHTPASSWDSGVVHGTLVAASFISGLVAPAESPFDPPHPTDPGHDNTPSKLDDALVLLAEAALLIAAITPNTFTPHTWWGDAARWLDIHEAYFAGAPIPSDPAGLTSPCLGNCGDDSPHDAHLKPGALEQLGEPVVHEEADPGRPAEMMATGGTVAPRDPLARIGEGSPGTTTADPANWWEEDVITICGATWNGELQPFCRLLKGHQPITFKGNIYQHADPAKGAYWNDVAQALETIAAGFPINPTYVPSAATPPPALPAEAQNRNDDDV